MVVSVGVGGSVGVASRAEPYHSMRGSGRVLISHFAATPNVPMPIHLSRYAARRVATKMLFLALRPVEPALNTWQALALRTEGAKILQ